MKLWQVVRVILSVAANERQRFDNVDKALADLKTLAQQQAETIATLNNTVASQADVLQKILDQVEPTEPVGFRFTIGQPIDQ